MVYKHGFSSPEFFAGYPPGSNPLSIFTFLDRHTKYRRTKPQGTGEYSYVLPGTEMEFFWRKSLLTLSEKIMFPPLV